MFPFIQLLRKATQVEVIFYAATFAESDFFSLVHESS